MNPQLYFALVSLLIGIALVGLISRRNLFVIYMSIELLLSAISLLLATLSRVLGDGGGSVMALLIIGVIAAEAALFLAMIVHLYAKRRSLDADRFDDLKERL